MNYIWFWLARCVAEFIAFLCFFGAAFVVVYCYVVMQEYKTGIKHYRKPKHRR